MLECRSYTYQRKELWKIGAGRMGVEKLPGFQKLVKHTLEYIALTKGLEISRGKERWANFDTRKNIKSQKSVKWQVEHGIG